MEEQLFAHTVIAQIIATIRGEDDQRILQLARLFHPSINRPT